MARASRRPSPRARNTSKRRAAGPTPRRGSGTVKRRSSASGSGNKRLCRRRGRNGAGFTVNRGKGSAPDGAAARPPGEAGLIDGGKGIVPPPPSAPALWDTRRELTAGHLPCRKFQSRRLGPGCGVCFSDSQYQRADKAQDIVRISAKSVPAQNGLRVCVLSCVLAGIPIPAFTKAKS